jgi:hypothetical protein
MRSDWWRSPATRVAAPAGPGAAIRYMAPSIVAPPARPAFRRAALLASVWVGALAILAPSPAQSVDGTWTGPGAEWTTGTNWSSSPTVPDNIATFTNIPGAPTFVTISGPGSTSINTIQFDAAAPAYSFAVDFRFFNINGAGIVNNSAFAPSFANNFSFISFNSGTAGNAAITNSGSTSFFGSSSAGTSIIVNNAGFLVAFSDSSTAGSATITTNGGVVFTTNSTGGNARFIANASGVVDFSGTSGPSGNNQITAGSIEGAGTINWARTSSRWAATIFRPR